MKAKKTHNPKINRKKKEGADSSDSPSKMRYLAISMMALLAIPTAFQEPALAEINSVYGAQIQNINSSQKYDKRIIGLVAQLSSKDKSTSLRAAHMLLDIGEPAIPYLIAALHNEAARKMAARSLAGIGEPAVSDLIVALHNKKISIMALNTLIGIGKPAVPQLLVALKEEQIQKRVEFILGHLGESIIPMLVPALGRNDINEAVVRILYRIGDPTIPFLIRSLDQKGLFMGISVTLTNIGESAIPPLMDEIRRGTKRRVGAGMTLEFMAAEGKPVFTYLVKELRREFSDPRTPVADINKNLATVFVSIGKRAIPHLEMIVNNKKENENLRKAAELILLFIKKKTDPKLMNKLLGTNSSKEVEALIASHENTTNDKERIGS